MFPHREVGNTDRLKRALGDGYLVAVTNAGRIPIAIVEADAPLRSTGRVRVAIFEQAELLRLKLNDLIPSLGPYEVVVSTADAWEFKELVNGRTDIDIALLGALGDEDEGCHLLVWMLERQPAVRSLVLCTSPKKASTERAVNGGAACVLCKGAGPAVLGTALEKLSVPGGTYFDHLAQEVYRPANGARGATAEEAQPTLTDKEAEVLKLLCKPGGAVYKEVAALLDMKMTTFYTHIRNLFKKFGVHAYQELVDKARVMGYHLG